MNEEGVFCKFKGGHRWLADYGNILREGDVITCEICSFRCVVVVVHDERWLAPYKDEK